MSTSITIPPGTVFRPRFLHDTRRKPLRVVGQVGASNRYIVESLDGSRRREASIATLFGLYEEDDA